MTRKYTRDRLRALVLKECQARGTDLKEPQVEALIEVLADVVIAIGDEIDERLGNNFTAVHVTERLEN